MYYRYVYYDSYVRNHGELHRIKIKDDKIKDMSNPCCADPRIPDEARWMGSPTSFRSCRLVRTDMPPEALSTGPPFGYQRW